MAGRAARVTWARTVLIADMGLQPEGKSRDHTGSGRILRPSEHLDGSTGDQG